MNKFVYSYLADVDDFSLAFSDLVLSLHEEPEPRLSVDWVRGEHSDSVEHWLGVLRGWDGSPYYEVLSDLHTQLANN